MSPGPGNPLELRTLDALLVTVVVDNASDSLSSTAPDLPRVTEMASLLGTTRPDRRHDGHDCITVFDQMCVACHGLSVLLTGHRGDETRTALFDAGPYGDVWVDNAGRLGIDLATIDTVFLSHWHWDHSGAIPVVVAAIVEARRAAGSDRPLVVDLHPDRPDRRGIQLPAGPMVMLPDEPTVASIEAAGGQVVTHAEAHLLGDGFFAASGAIPRRTAYETGLPGHHSFCGEDVRPDPLILDERLLVAKVRGRGLSVLSACSHAGIVNACLEAQRLVPGEPTDLVLGGYHLAGATVEDRIPATVRDLVEQIDPRVVAPGHCTGWRAGAALAEAFAPNAFAPCAVGTRYALTAP